MLKIYAGIFFFIIVKSSRNNKPSVEKDLGTAQGDHCQEKNWEESRETQVGRPDNMWESHQRGKGGRDTVSLYR